MANSIHSKKSINTLMKLCKQITLTFNVLIGITLSLLLDQEIYKILNSYFWNAVIHLTFHLYTKISYLISQIHKVSMSKILIFLKNMQKNVVQLLIIYRLIKFNDIMLNVIKTTQVIMMIGKQLCITMIKCLIQTATTISLLNENLN